MNWCLLAFLLLAIPGRAQETPLLLLEAAPEDAVGTATEQRDLCFRGRPLAECRAFWVFEATPGYASWAGEGFSNRTESRFVLGGNVGWMSNISARDAIGGVVSADNVYFVTLGPRYRRWINPSTSVDAGIAIGAAAQFRTAVMFKDQVGVWATVSHTFGWVDSFGRTTNGISAGVQTGSHAAVASVGVAVLGVLGVIVVAIVK